MSNAAVLRFALGLVLAAACLASPLPPGGAFAYRGQPAFATGFWAFTSIPSDFANGSRVILQNIDGRIFHTYSAFPTLDVGRLELSMGSYVERALSFQCVDDQTYRVIYNATAYSMSEYSGSVHITGNPAFTTCAIVRVDGDLLRVSEAFTARGCPDVINLPAGDIPGEFTGGTYGGAIYRRVPSSLTPRITKCVNRTVTTTNWAKLPPLAAVGDPVATAGPPCATYQKTGNQAGSAASQGIWRTSLGPAIMTDSLLGWSTLAWDPSMNPASAGVTLALYRSSVCFGDSAKTASYLTQRFLNGTVQSFWVCDTRTREDNRLNVKFSTPNFLYVPFTEIAPLPDKPQRKCRAPTPQPFPPTAPCTKRAKRHGSCY